MIAPVHPLDIQLPLPLTPTHESSDRRTRSRSSTFATITNWASAVQPGTPAPLSPLQRRRPSLIRRVASNSAFPSFLVTPKTPQFAKVDLTSWGYTSVFLNLPITPATPSPLPQPTKPGKGLQKIKSMGLLRRNRTKSVIGEVAAPSTTANITPPRSRSRSRSRSGSISPTKPSLKRPGHVKSKSVSATTPQKSNKSHPPLPPALQNELLLMQLVSGGSLESNAQRMMEQRAKTNGNMSTGVDAVYRDETGVMWLDEHERVEYEALIPIHSPSSLPPSPWVQFTPANGLKPASPTLGAMQTDDEDPARRPSVVSLSPTERELDGAAALVHPASPMPYIDTGLEMIPPASALSIDRTERRRRRRPAPLKLHSSSSIPQTQPGFEDSFEPSSAEAAALAAGMHSYASRRVANQGFARRTAVNSTAIHVEAGSAPADVTSFETASRTTMKSKKLNLAKRAKALFGLE